MGRDEDFRLRPGRARSTRRQRQRPFLAQALAAAERAGGRVSPSGRIGRGDRSRFGRGRAASVRAQHRLGPRARQAIVKTRIVRHRGGRAAIAAHLSYLRRDGVTRDGEKGQLFGHDADAVEPRGFAERIADDRHHFRWIVSPEDAVELADLRGFTRDFMARVEGDLGTRLDWVAVDHWNTDNPHVHILVRGRADGADLVISRDYLTSGLRARAQALATEELGPRSEHDIARAFARQVDAERWTPLDRSLLREVGERGWVDTRPPQKREAVSLQSLKAGRLRTLDRLGLAEELGAGQWRLAPDAEPRLRALGERDDILRRMHRAMAQAGFAGGPDRWALEAEPRAPVLGRLVARGLDDELKGSAWAIVDGVDGRAHHLRFDDLMASGDAEPGAIVELRRFADRLGRPREALAVRSDLPLEAQLGVDGATWLDRRLVSGEPMVLGDGFGTEVRAALAQRGERLMTQGLAERRGGRLVFARALLDALRARELDAAAAQISRESGKPSRAVAPGERVSGTYQRRLVLASGRFAMIDDGLGFSLVPWTPALERQLGKAVDGLARPDGGIDWRFARGRGLGL